MIFHSIKIIGAFLFALVCWAPNIRADSNVGAFTLQLVAEQDEVAKDPGAYVRAQHWSASEQTHLWLSRKIELDIRDVAEAVLEEEPAYGIGPSILVKLTDGGKSKFAALTSKNVGKKLALLSQGKLLTAPVIRETITGGELMITGAFSSEEAKTIVAKIMAGRGFNS